MKKTIITLFTFIILTGAIYIVFFTNSISKNNSGKNNFITQKKQDILDKKKSVLEDKTENYKEEIDDDKKNTTKNTTEVNKENETQKKITFHEMQKKFSQKGLMSQGDMFFEKKQLTRALKSYLAIERKDPKNMLIKKKIADTYFEMKKFHNTYKYLKEVFGEVELDEKRILSSYVSTLDFKNLQADDKGNIIIDTTDIEDLGLHTDNIFFLKTSINCIASQKKCQSQFEKYIKGKKIKKDSNLYHIKQALKNYNNFNIKKQYLKDTQFLTAIFQSGLYPISNVLGEKILIEKKGYLPVLKIISQGYYKLGKYQKAKDFLKEYTNFDNTDAQVYYMLGVINIKMHEYVLSNIYFIKSKKLGFSPTSSISKRLIYNYYLVEDFPNMFVEFNSLLDASNGLQANDFSLAIYYALIHKKTHLAQKWITIARKKYPKNSDFYGYKGWVYKEAGDTISAREILLEGYKLDKHNPLISLNLGIIETEELNYRRAKIYLRNTIAQDSDGDFGKMAYDELQKLQEIEEKDKENMDNLIDNYIQ